MSKEEMIEYLDEKIQELVDCLIRAQVLRAQLIEEEDS